MSTDVLVPGRWTRGQWLGIIALVCALQVALLFSLGDSKPKPHSAPAQAPVLRVADASAGDLLALMDPTIFALPHRRGFSGPGWLLVPPQEFQAYVWSNPPGWLELPVADLGQAFQQFIQTNSFNTFEVLPQLQPELTWPTLTKTRGLPQESGFRVTGDLAGRRMLTMPVLPPQPNPELLTNSVVQLVVDAAGVPVSLTLLVGSGKKEADQYALAQARAARFQPANPAGKPSALAGLSWGLLIFEWHTIPPLTNAPPEGQ